MRNKFSVRMTISKSAAAVAAAGNTYSSSRTITFVVMKHDLAALETDLPHYSGIQPFIECTPSPPVPSRLVCMRSYINRPPRASGPYRSPRPGPLHRNRPIRSQRSIHRSHDSSSLLTISHQTARPQYQQQRARPRHHGLSSSQNAVRSPWEGMDSACPGTEVLD